MSDALVHSQELTKRCEDVEQFASSIARVAEVAKGLMSLVRSSRRLIRSAVHLERRLDDVIDLLDIGQLERMTDDEVDPVLQSLQRVCMALEDLQEPLGNARFFVRMVLQRTYRRIPIACESIEDTVEAEMLSRNTEFSGLVQQRIIEVDKLYDKKKIDRSVKMSNI